MKTEKLASILNGRQYGQEITKEEQQQAKENNLVVVFGYSDDCMEFRGAIYDEVGSEASITPDGMLENECGEWDCPYHEKEKEKAKLIKAVWCTEKDGEVYASWIYQTSIPHEPFNIYRDGDLFCGGIVFSMEDVEKKK